MRGEPVIGGLHGSPRHYFCSYCMSWAFTRPEGLEHLVNVRATLLDDPSRFSPFIETCTREKLPWATTPAVHSFEGMPVYEDFPRLLEDYARGAAPASRDAGLRKLGVTGSNSENDRPAGSSGFERSVGFRSLAQGQAQSYSRP